MKYKSWSHQLQQSELGTEMICRVSRIIPISFIFIRWAAWAVGLFFPNWFFCLSIVLSWSHVPHTLVIISCRHVHSLFLSLSLSVSVFALSFCFTFINDVYCFISNIKCKEKLPPKSVCLPYFLFMIFVSFRWFTNRNLKSRYDMQNPIY